MGSVGVREKTTLEMMLVYQALVPEHSPHRSPERSLMIQVLKGFINHS